MPDSPTPQSALERPVGLPAPSNALFGSDAIAEALRDLRIPFIALNPGASYRGLHDSLVNHLGNEAPQMLLCLHEEHAVAIAQGWAKVTGTPMLAAVHSNVGLFHATMAIFNAWCDRMPVIVLGATGPMGARPAPPLRTSRSWTWMPSGCGSYSPCRWTASVRVDVDRTHRRGAGDQAARNIASRAAE
jgi:Thiamine pyrophosphate enzyme, N-terminal TPP binding domain